LSDAGENFMTAAFPAMYTDIRIDDIEALFLEKTRLVC